MLKRKLKLIQEYVLMASPVPPSSVGYPEVVPKVTQTAPMADAPVSPSNSDPTLPEGEFDRL